MVRDYLVQKGTDPSNILLVNKESLEYSWMEKDDQLVSHVQDFFSSKRGKKYLFVDEIQEIAKWEKAVAGFLADELADLIITGSNSKMLSSELATHIAGRYVEFTMNTLTFSEFLDFRKKDPQDRQKVAEEFKNYLICGGFPGIHHMEFEHEVIRQYISSIKNTVFLKDVVARNNIRDVSLLEKIAKFIADNVGNITSSKKIADFLKSQQIKNSVDTVQNYLDMLCSAYILHKIPRYDIKGKRILEVHEKYYCGDLGLKNSLTMYRPDDISGQLENIIYLELTARGYQVFVGKVNELEVDFIAQKNQDRIYYQVAYLLPNQATVAREFGSLEKINDNYPKYVLSMDQFFPDNRDGIKWMNILHFLTGN